MVNFLLIFCCLVLGVFLKYKRLFPAEGYAGLNAFIIYISLPALTLYYVPKIAFSAEIVLPFLAGWLPLLLAFPFFRLLQKLLGFSSETTACLTLVCGLGNVSFVGYPVIEAYYGAEGLEIAVMVGQGAFLALSVLGVPFAIRHSSGELHPSELVRKTLVFPPFIAFVGCLFLVGLGVEIPAQADQVLKRLADTLTPLAITSIGLQLTISRQTAKVGLLASGMTYKLVLAPLLILFALSFFLPVSSLILKVSVMEAAMPSMVTAAIIASQYRLNSQLANQLVGLTLVIGLPLLFLWNLVLG